MLVSCCLPPVAAVFQHPETRTILNEPAKKDTQNASAEGMSPFDNEKWPRAP